jgi:serine/threonine protein kinase
MKICSQCGGSYPNDFQVCPRDQKPLQLSSELAVGMEIRNKWIILGKIGTGGMAKVYRAQHRAFGTIRAIKVIDARLAEDPGFVKRFHAEAVLAQKLDHPNVIRIEDLDTTDDGRPFIVMECVEGRDLRSIIREQGRLPIARALAVTSQVASALAAAHKLGITHRDVKPDNILVVTTPDGQDHVKVTDFGIAKARHGSTAGTYTFGTETGIAVGTPAYMSPEQVLGRSEAIDARSDLYSLCIVLYEMLTGKLPFHSDTPLGMALSRLNEPPTPPQQVPGVYIPQLLSDVLMKALERDRDRRFQSANELIDVLQSYATASLSASATDAFASNSSYSAKESETTARLDVNDDPKDETYQVVQGEEGSSRARYLAIGAVALVLLITGVAVVEKQQRSSDVEQERSAAQLQPTGYVNDFAPVLDPATKAQIEDLARQVDAKAHAQIALVTIDSLGGSDIKSLAVNLFNKWGIGDKATNRGVLILYSIRDRQSRIEVGYGLEKILSDWKVASYQTEAAPLMGRGDYNEGLLLVTSRVVSVIAQDAGVQVPEPVLNNQPPRPAPDTPSTASTQKASERNVQPLIAEGERQWEQGNYDEAISSFRKALKIDPKNSIAINGVRKAQKAKSDEEKALLDAK